MTDQEYRRAGEDLWNRMEAMRAVFVQRGFPELAAAMDDALEQHFASDIYTAARICAYDGLNEPALGSEAHAELKTILKMIKTMYRQAR